MVTWEYKVFAHDRDLLQQIETLKKQAEEVRQQEIAEAIKDIKATMSEYGITPADLGFSVAARAGKASKAPAAAKYRNPTSDDTWSEKGRAPKWLQEAEALGQSREQFLIG